MDTMFQNENVLFDFIGNMLDVYSFTQQDLYEDMKDTTEEQKKDWLRLAIWDYILSIKLTYEPILGMLYHSGAVKHEIARELIFENFIDIDDED